MLGDPDKMADNLIDYTSAFSANVSYIFDRFAFDKTVHKLAEKNRLYFVVEAFSDIDLHPDRVSNADMGEIFEHLIFKFSTASNETAGEHFTPRDAIRLIVDLVLAPDDDLLATPGAVRSIYDPTAGTGGMLSVAEEAILAMNPAGGRQSQLRRDGQKNPAGGAVDPHRHGRLDYGRANQRGRRRLVEPLAATRPRLGSNLRTHARCAANLHSETCGPVALCELSRR